MSIHILYNEVSLHNIFVIIYHENSSIVFKYKGSFSNFMCLIVEIVNNKYYFTYY